MEAVLDFLEFALISTAVLAGYFLPAIIAQIRDPLGAFPVFNLNLFLGWTVVGWFFALYLSLRKPPPNKRPEE